MWQRCVNRSRGGAGQPFVAEHLGAEDVEQQFRAGFAVRHVTELVEDQEIELGQLLPQPQKLLLFARFQEQRDQLGDAGEVLYPISAHLLHSPMVAVAALSVSSVSVIGNALRLRTPRPL